MWAADTLRGAAVVVAAEAAAMVVAGRAALVTVAVGGGGGGCYICLFCWSLSKRDHLTRYSTV